MKYLFITAVILCTVYFIFFNKDKIQEDTITENKKNEYFVNLIDGDNILKLNLEDYVVGVVACEMPALFEEEALKAMAVAARTYALNKGTNNLENSTNDQCYNNEEEMKNKWKNDYDVYYQKIKKAVYSTESLCLTYNEKIIKALYFSTSNGYTENIKDVFGESLEYLTSVDSPWDIDTRNFKKTIEYEEKEFLKLLGLNDEKINNITINEYTSSNRVGKITINNKIFKGTEIRKLLKLRSTDFSFEQKNNKIYITTKGYGHGVGLSQYGANGMAKEGKKYDEILKYYYKNVEIKSV